MFPVRWVWQTFRPGHLMCLVVASFKYPRHTWVFTVWESYFGRVCLSGSPLSVITAVNLTPSTSFNLPVPDARAVLKLEPGSRNDSSDGP